MEEMLVDALDALLADCCTPDVVRQAEQNHDVAALWQQIRESGFTDALLTEEQGGAGLTLAQAYPLLELCGKYALPLPLAETMLARAALADAGVDLPDGLIALAQAERDTDSGDVLAYRVPYGRVAHWVLLDVQGDIRLLAADQARADDQGLFPLDIDVRWSEADWQSAARLDNVASLRVLQACAVAATAVGSMLAVYQKTLEYANERNQFGRPIGKFQVIQHQLSVLAEEVFASRMAASIGCHSSTWRPDPLSVAVAKARTSEAVLHVADISHAVHGAIGITEEYDLQLYTRRLHRDRQTAGSETYWHQKAGAALLARTDAMTLDTIRELTD